MGCGGGSGKTAHVQGKVTIGGKDIPTDARAFIMFTDAKDMKKSASVPIESGAYDSPKTPTGAVRVSFDITKPTGPVKKSERTGEDYQDMANLVPPAKTSGVEVTIDGDKNDLNFNL